MPRESYAKAGVDLRKVKAIQASIGSAFGSTFSNRAKMFGAPLIPIGHYAGIIDIGGGRGLALHTDNVGTKALVAQELGRFDTIGIDCVAMTVNDLICLGSEPLAVLDYMALEREDAELVSELVKGLVKGASLAGVAVVGGETAILGDMIKGRAGRGFDLASMGVGIVETAKIIDGSAIREGDAILGVASSGLHSNGYTLARKILRRIPLKSRVESLGTTLGEALLEPTSIYVSPTLRATRGVKVHGIAHITGGSFSKLSRLVGGRDLRFEIKLPPPPEIFKLLQREGGVSDREMYRTFNMGVGLCLCLQKEDLGSVSRIFKSGGFATTVLGSVKEGTGVRVNGVSVA